MKLFCMLSFHALPFRTLSFCMLSFCMLSFSMLPLRSLFHHVTNRKYNCSLSVAFHPLKLFPERLLYMEKFFYDLLSPVSIKIS